MEKVTTYHNARKFKSCIVCQFIVILLRLRLTAASEFITTLIKTQDLFTEVILKILESIRLEINFMNITTLILLKFILSNPCSIVLVNMIIFKNKMMNYENHTYEKNYTYNYEKIGTFYHNKNNLYHVINIQWYITCVLELHKRQIL